MHRHQHFVCLLETHKVCHLKCNSFINSLYFPWIYSHITKITHDVIILRIDDVSSGNSTQCEYYALRHILVSPVLVHSHLGCAVDLKRKKGSDILCAK